MSKQGTIDQLPLYGCINCCEWQTYPADHLAVYEGECWCKDCWDGGKGHETGIEYDELPEFEPNHTLPQHADQHSTPDVTALVEALEELIDLMEATYEGEYTPDSLTTQPAHIALAAYREQLGGNLL